jgi:ribonuclease P protein component
MDIACECRHQMVKKSLIDEEQRAVKFWHQQSLQSNCVSQALESKTLYPIPLGSFRRKDRILRKIDFRRVMTQGQRRRTHLVSVVLCRSTTLQSRIGLSVSKRYGNVPSRNLMRRLLRENFRAVRQDFPLTIDVVVIVRRPWKRVNLFEVLKEMARVMEQIDWDKLVI